MTPDLVDRLRDHIASSGLIRGPGRALLAVSGGPDSVALAQLMVRLAEELEVQLLVGHVDHGILPDSAAVARSVEALARRLELPFHGARLELGAAATETAARRGRYAALRRIQREQTARYLLTGHHADDQAETVLYRALRGSGPAGLAGIPAAGPEGLIRPLLPFAKRDLAEWLEAAGGMPGVHHDPSNADRRHDRAWIRGHLLPAVRDRFGDSGTHGLLELADQAAADRHAWSALLRALPELGFRRSGRGVEVARTPLRTYHKSLGQAMLRAMAREVGCTVGRRRAQRLWSFVQRASSGRMLQLGGDWVAEIAFERLRIFAFREAAGPGPAVELPWGGAGEGERCFGSWTIRWRPGVAGRLTRRGLTTWVTEGEGGVVRPPRAGDRILPVGGIGRRPVSRLLMEGKIARSERRGFPVLVRDDQVLWLPGICRAGAAVPEPGKAAVQLDARAGGDS